MILSRGRRRKAPYEKMRRLRGAQNKAGNMHQILGLSPSGKVQDFDSCIRWFESIQPCYQRKLVYIMLFYGNGAMAKTLYAG